VRGVLVGHEPYPALVVDRGWHLVEANTSVAPLIDGVAPWLLEPPANVLRLSLHPEGLAGRIANLGEWRAHLLSRLRRQVERTGSTEIAELLAELRGYPCEQPEPSVEVPGPGDVAVPLRLDYAGGELTLLSMVATFGTPLDVTVAELSIEAFYPGDPATAKVLRGD
jgi:hypothetical protein